MEVNQKVGRKIDDNILQKMRAEGKPQKEMARFFGVSDAAISKRIKRLHQIEPPESFSRLTDKQKKFALAKAEGKTNTEAAMIAFEVTSRESAKVLGSNTMKDPDTNTAIQDLLHQEGIGRRYRIQRLKKVIDAADLGISSKGLDMSFKLTGEYGQEEGNVSGQVAAVFALVAEIKARGKKEPEPLPERIDDHD